MSDHILLSIHHMWCINFHIPSPDHVSAHCQSFTVISDQSFIENFLILCWHIYSVVSEVEEDTCCICSHLTIFYIQHLLHYTQIYTTYSASMGLIFLCNSLCTLLYCMKHIPIINVRDCVQFYKNWPLEYRVFVRWNIHWCMHPLSRHIVYWIFQQAFVIEPCLTIISLDGKSSTCTTGCFQ